MNSIRVLLADDQAKAAPLAKFRAPVFKMPGAPTLPGARMPSTVTFPTVLP